MQLLETEYLEHAEQTVESPAVLFPHGMFGKAEDWSACADYLSSRWKVLVPELPVFDMPREETGIEGLGGYVKQWIDEQGIGRVVLGGNSLGGHLALHLALRLPGRVQALILTGSSGLMERGFERNVPRRPTREWLRTKTREVFYDAAHVTDELLDEVIATISDPRRAIKILRVAKSVKHDNLRAVLHHITCPTLLVWGTNDNITPPSVAGEFKECIPNAELRFIRNCGHAPMIEQPREFNRIVEEFLDQVIPDGPRSPLSSMSERVDSLTHLRLLLPKMGLN